MSEETSTEVVEETSVVEPEATTEEPSSEHEEPQNNEQPLYADKYKTPEEVVEAYKKANAENTRMAQELAKYKKAVSRPQDEQEIIDQMKALGMVTKEDLLQFKAVSTQEAIDNKEISNLGLDKKQETALRKFASHPDNLNKSMTELWDELTGSIGGKVVSRKVTIKPKTGTRGTFTKLSTKEIARLSPEAYDKYWEDYKASK